MYVQTIQYPLPVDKVRISCTSYISQTQTVTDLSDNKLDKTIQMLYCTTTTSLLSWKQ